MTFSGMVEEETSQGQGQGMMTDECWHVWRNLSDNVIFGTGCPSTCFAVKFIGT